MEIADESSNAGEVVCVEFSRDCRRFGLDGGDVVVFGSERQAPQLGTSGVSTSFKYDGLVVLRVDGHVVAVR